MSIPAAEMLNRGKKGQKSLFLAPVVMFLAVSCESFTRLHIVNNYANTLTINARHVTTTAGGAVGALFLHKPEVAPGKSRFQISGKR